MMRLFCNTFCTVDTENRCCQIQWFEKLKVTAGFSGDVVKSVAGLLAPDSSSGGSCLMQVMRCIHAYSSGFKRGVFRHTCDLDIRISVESYFLG